MIRLLKVFLPWLVVAALSMFIGAYLHKCQSPIPATGPQGYAIDTVSYIDTISYYEPKPKISRQIGSSIKNLPVHKRPADPPKKISSPTSGHSANSDSANTAIHNIPETLPDSVKVEIPIIQKEYEGKDYHVWISGFDPKMDSIYVFPRHKTVTIREHPNRPKRWGVGVFAGYGITPQGFQPCVGVSIHYTLWNF